MGAELPRARNCQNLQSEEVPGAEAIDGRLPLHVTSLPSSRTNEKVCDLSTFNTSCLKTRDATKIFEAMRPRRHADP